MFLSKPYHGGVMAVLTLRIFVAGVVLALITPLCCPAQTQIACDEEQVDYSPFDPSFSNRIILGPLDKAYVPPAENERKFSPQHDMWLVQTDPDFSKPGPWTTTIVIGTSRKGRPSKLTLVDHASGGVHAQWLNEKLLFVQVWWGRIVSTDLILDVERRSFMYEEMADYGDFIQPCQ